MRSAARERRDFRFRMLSMQPKREPARIGAWQGILGLNSSVAGGSGAGVFDHQVSGMSYPGAASAPRNWFR